MRRHEATARGAQPAGRCELEPGTSSARNVGDPLQLHRATVRWILLEILAGMVGLSSSIRRGRRESRIWQELAMTAADIGLRRLAQQRLTGQRFATPQDVVGWFGAVQSQEYLGAIWSLGMRMGADATDDVIERAFTEGTIL